MGINVFPVPSTGKVKKTQVFTSSGTWTAPTSANYDGVVDVVVVGAGGGGGGGAGAGSGYQANTSSSERPGGLGGGGGGAGEFIALESYPVTSGTTVAVTVGSGGTGGQTSTSDTVFNYILNPSFETNTTGWSAVSGFNIARGTNPASTALSMSNSYNLNLTNTTNTGLAFRYDSGNDAFTVNSGGTGYRLTYAYTADTVSGTQSYTFALDVSWYDNATLIRTDNVSTSTQINASSTNVYRTRTLSFTSAPIPTNATRVVIDWKNGTATTASSYTLRLDQVLLTGADMGSFNYTIPSNGNSEYIQADALSNFSGSTTPAFVWSGTAHASTTVMKGSYGAGLNGGTQQTDDILCCGNRGANGTKGGNSSFGLITAQGGGAGMGGDANRFRTAGSFSTYYFSGFNNQSLNTTLQSGGSGGANGGRCDTGALRQQLGTGGGGAKGWDNTLGRYGATPSAGNYRQSMMNLQGGYGIQGQGARWNGSTDVGNWNANDSGGYIPSIGGAGIDLYSWGGDGGLIGATGFGKSYAASATTTTTSYNSTSDKNLVTFASWKSAAGGTPGTADSPALGGAGGNGGNGANGAYYGCGGGGGSGGGVGSATTVGGSTLADPGDGGSGGNGADGIVIVSWWE